MSKNPQKSLGGHVITYCRTHPAEISTSLCADCGASMCYGCLEESDKYGTTAFCPACLQQMKEIALFLNKEENMTAYLVKMQEIERRKNFFYAILSTIALTAALFIIIFSTYNILQDPAPGNTRSLVILLLIINFSFLGLVGFPSAVFFLYPPIPDTGGGGFTEEVRRMKIRNDTFFKSIIKESMYAFPKMIIYLLFKHTQFFLCLAVGLFFSLVNPYRFWAKARQYNAARISALQARPQHPTQKQIPGTSTKNLEKLSSSVTQRARS